MRQRRRESWQKELVKRLKMPQRWKNYARLWKQRKPLKRLSEKPWRSKCVLKWQDFKPKLKQGRMTRRRREKLKSGKSNFVRRLRLSWKKSELQLQHVKENAKNVSGKKRSRLGFARQRALLLKISLRCYYPWYVTLTCLLLSLGVTTSNSVPTCIHKGLTSVINLQR